MILINISFLYEDYILIICITYEETLGIHFNITNAANAFISLTSTQYPVTSVATSAMIISNYPVTNTALTSYTTSEVVDSDQFLSDVSYWLRDYYAYSLVHNTYIEKDINLTCSSSGGSTVTHTRIANGANPIPSWATIDSANSKLLITTPLLTTETNFTFGISSYVSSDAKAYVKNVYLQVIVPKTPTSQTTKDTSVPFPLSTYIILSVAVLAESVVSLLNFSTSASFWLIIGKYQLLTILPLVGAYMPSDIVKYCAGLKIFLFSGNIVDPQSLFGLRPIYSYMDRDQSNDYLVQIGVESESTFVNIFSLQLIVILFMCLHIIVLILYWKMRPFSLTEKKFIRKIVKFLFNLFTFDVYIMVIIACFLFVTLSSMLETYYMKTRVLSILLSFIVLLFQIFFLGLCLFNWYKTRISENNRQLSYCRKLYPELKDRRKAGLYLFAELMRVAGLLICISYLNAIPFAARCSLYTICQFIFLILIVIQRPFRKVIANIMKILNEINYFILCIALNFLETKDQWSTVTEKCYLYLMMSISVQITILSLIDLIITIIQKCIAWRNKVKPKVTVNKTSPRMIEVDCGIPNSSVIESLRRPNAPSTMNHKSSSSILFHPKEGEFSKFSHKSSEFQNEVELRYEDHKL